MPSRFPVVLALIFCASAAAQSSTPARAVIEGAVLNSATNAPISGARVKIETNDADPLYGKTDSQGHFQFQNLGSDAYQLAAEYPGFLFSGESATMHAGSAYISLRDRPSPRKTGVTVARSTDPDGTLRAQVTVLLTPAAVIAGTLTDPYGTPLAGSPIELLIRQPIQPGSPPSSWPGRNRLPDSQNEIASVAGVQTNDRGEFRIARLAAGTYYVVANQGRLGVGAWERTFHATYYPHTTDLASAKPIQLAAGDHVRADIQIFKQSGVRVTGVLLNLPHADAVPGVFIHTTLTLIPANNFLPNPDAPFTTAQHDRFEFNDVVPGKYTLVALTREVSGPFGRPDKGSLGARRPIEIGNRNDDSLTVELVPLREVTGTVTFPQGCSAPLHININAYSNLGASRADVPVGPDGAFTFGGLAPAHYTVGVLGPPTIAATSARLGDREVLRDGFDYPPPPGETLKITVGCPSGRSR
ncbi:MAG TPA: carboxypeptidase-like regulatory domain-containing protein [Bryobacteraceae bacterium]|nr:carboxypeptidase-like regulatory domain-containing protein [Bryobacteraceae bacterium]